MNEQQELFEEPQVPAPIMFEFESVNEIGALLNALDGFVRATGLQGASEVLELATRLSLFARSHVVNAGDL